MLYIFYNVLQKLKISYHRQNVQVNVQVIRFLNSFCNMLF